MGRNQRKSKKRKRIKMKIYCAYDHLNCESAPKSQEEVHACEYYNSYLCNACPSRYDGDKVKKYMEDNPRVEH